MRLLHDVAVALALGLSAGLIFDAGEVELRDEAQERAAVVVIAVVVEGRGGDDLGSASFDRTLTEVADYFEAVSYGRLRIEFKRVGTLQPRAGLVNLGPTADQVERKRFLAELLEEVHAPSGDGLNLMLVAIRGNIWPFTMQYPLSPAVEPARVSVVRTVDDWGTMAHEVGHLLGLQDLYDHERAGEGVLAATQVGAWCLMSRSLRRPALCAWSRMQLGIIRPSEVVTVHRGTSRSIEIDSLSLPQERPLVIKLPVASSRYYLVEARARSGYDSMLPDDGVLITRVNYFTSDVAERVLLMDAAPETETLDDAAFGEHTGKDVFAAHMDEIEIKVLRREGSSYLLQLRNGRIDEEVM